MTRLGRARQPREAREATEIRHTGQPAAAAAKASGERGHRLLLEFVDRVHRVPVGGQHEIRQRLGYLLAIVAVDRRGRD